MRTIDPDILTPSDEGSLLDAGGDRHRLWLLLGLDAGLRVSEMVRISPDNLQPGTPLLRLHGKGGRRRTIPLTYRLREAIRAEDLRRLAWRVPPERPYVPRCTRSVQRWFKDLCRQAGINLPGRTPHSLRHTYASRLVAAGVPLPIVQRVLGHSSLATTQVYLHTLPGWEEELLRRVELWQLEHLESPSHSWQKATRRPSPLSYYGLGRGWSRRRNPMNILRRMSQRLRRRRSGRE